MAELAKINNVPYADVLNYLEVGLRYVDSASMWA